MAWVWGVCIGGTVLVSGLLALQVSSVQIIDQPMQIDGSYKLLVLGGAVVAGGLWGSLTKSLAREHRSWVWLPVFLGLLGAQVLGQAFLHWLLTANLSDILFPVTRAAWNWLVDGPEGFLFFLFLVLFTFVIDLFLLLPTLIALPFIPFVVLTGGPLLGGLAGSGLGRLGLRVFVKR